MKLKTKFKSQNGITLIALVITIIVLLILAGVSINALLSDNGIIDRAKDAQNKMDEATQKDLEKINSSNNWLEENGGIKNSTSNGGDTPTATWTQNKTTVTNGTTTYEVGDSYTYNCGVSSYTGGWKVLGAENGKLLIMSTEDIGTLELSGKEGYNTGVSQLNEMCKQYGTNARSIKVEDINRVTGYDPNNTGDGKKYGAGEIYEYGNQVTYTASGSTATNGKTYTGSLNKNKYEHPDGRIIGTNGVTAIKETSTDYSYYPNTLTGGTIGTIKGIETTSKAYKLLFRNAGDTANCSYWLASSCVRANLSYSNFHLYCVNTSGYVGSCYLWHSGDAAASHSMGVRTVISL